jgi:hypothetical protein
MHLKELHSIGARISLKPVAWCLQVWHYRYVGVGDGDCDCDGVGVGVCDGDGVGIGVRVGVVFALTNRVIYLTTSSPLLQVLEERISQEDCQIKVAIHAVHCYECN